MSEVISDANFSEKTSKGKVVVDFYADWCGPCQLMKPVFDKASSEHKDVHFFKVDVDANSSAPEQFGVRSIPTVIFLKDGKEVDRAIGYVHEPAFNEKLKKAFH
jgi:thioredoxin 1